jgi:crotonobetainyl-CoA:carnitine CoA-transferase CaiB-like acyl-CoA transferase
MLGADTDEVLQRWLGLAAGDIAALHAEGVV